MSEVSAAGYAAVQSQQDTTKCFTATATSGGERCCLRQRLHCLIQKDMGSSGWDITVLQKADYTKSQVVEPPPQCLQTEHKIVCPEVTKQIYTTMSLVQKIQTKLFISNVCQCHYRELSVTTIKVHRQVLCSPITTVWQYSSVFVDSVGCRAVGQYLNCIT